MEVQGGIERVIGKKSGRLTVVSYYGKSYKGNMWNCTCECGQTLTVATKDINSQNIKSCGCLKSDVLTKRNKGMATHNKTNTRLYRIWGNIKDRCYNENSKDYINYGSRGITICEEWLINFESFYNWSMENGYKEDLTIDRINNDLGYSPDNCRWVSMKIQINNTRKNINITIGGITKTASEWADISGINSKTIIYRFKNGWDEDKLLIKPNRRNRYGKNKSN